MSSLSKRQATRVDRISALPDTVLRHILGFLPTINSVETSFLSRRWNDLWASVPNLDFDQDYFDSSCYARFVDSVLFFRDSTDIHTFRCHCYSIEDFSRVDGWIATAIRRKVVELDLCVESNEEEIYELPERLYLCKTLMGLRLHSNFFINPPKSGCFPSLKSLYVDIIDLTNKSMEKLFSSLPVLEHLHINRTCPQGDAAVNFTISAPELKTLRIKLSNMHGEKFCFYVAARKLEHFALDQCVLTDRFLENANSLVRANLHWRHSANEEHRFTFRATALLAGISNVKYLSLSSHNLKGCCLPVFDNLRKLKLDLYYCYCWELLTEMLKRSRNLEYLELQLGNACGESTEPEWTEPEHVPVCLLSHLTAISIRGYKGYKALYQSYVAKYLLKNGKVMNTMTIYTDDAWVNGELEAEIPRFQRGSETCQVKAIFVWDSKGFH